MDKKQKTCGCKGPCDCNRTPGRPKAAEIYRKIIETKDTKMDQTLHEKVVSVIEAKKKKMMPMSGEQTPVDTKPETKKPKMEDHLAEFGPKIDEEIEQVDELKTKTLVSYANKRQRQADSNQKKGAKAEDDAMGVDGMKQPEKQKKLQDKASDHFAKADKQQSGVNMAVAKVGDKTAKKIRPSETWGARDNIPKAKVMAKEEVELSDEEKAFIETEMAEAKGEDAQERQSNSDMAKAAKEQAQKKMKEKEHVQKAKEAEQKKNEINRMRDQVAQMNSYTPEVAGSLIEAIKKTLGK